MINNYLEDYYNGSIKTGELAGVLGVRPTEMSNYFKQRGLLTYNKHLERLNFENKKLKTILVSKFNSLRGRCNGIKNGRCNHIYEGMSHLNVIEWVDFCNKNKVLLETMWEEYILSNNNLKYTISIDRVDNNKGYEVQNIQFITQGFNSWKANINRPIKAKHKESNEWLYFMSCTEGSRHYNIRDRDFGEILRKDGSYNKDYDVELSDIETVLIEAKCIDIVEYYNKFIK